MHLKQAGNQTRDNKKNQKRQSLRYQLYTHYWLLNQDGEIQNILISKMQDLFLCSAIYSEKKQEKNFDMEELEEVIKSIHKGKATGPDNIPSR